MKACFNMKTGEYRDQADSFKIYPGDAEFIAHVAKRYGEDAKDLVIVETEQPWTKKLVDGEAVVDVDKTAALQAEQDAAVAGAQRMTDLESKFASGTATLAEVQEYLSKRVG